MERPGTFTPLRALPLDMLHLLTTLRRPDTVIMDLTSRCNLRCVMCYFSEVDRLSFEPYDRTLSDNGDMPLEVFETVAGELFPKAWRVALGCAAEPMLHLLWSNQP